MTNLGAITAFLISVLGSSSWASDTLLSGVELYIGYGSVILEPETKEGGLYIFDRLETGVRFLSTFNYSYGNPFMIMDIKSRDILFRNIADDGGQRYVTFWKVGEGENFFELLQEEPPKIYKSKCPADGHRSPLVSKTVFVGQNQEGWAVEIEETHPLPHGLCSKDQFKYILKWKSDLVPEKVKSDFENDLKISLYRFFGIHESEFEIQSIH